MCIVESTSYINKSCDEWGDCNDIEWFYTKKSILYKFKNTELYDILKSTDLPIKQNTNNPNNFIRKLAQITANNNLKIHVYKNNPEDCFMIKIFDISDKKSIESKNNLSYNETVDILDLYDVCSDKLLKKLQRFW